MKLALTCDDWKAFRKNTLLGFATIKIEALRLTIKDIAVHEKSGRRWVQLPARPQIKDNAVVKSTDGKVQYFPLLAFDSREVGDAFSAAVCTAILQHEPRAFAAEYASSAPAPNREFNDEIPF